MSGRERIAAAVTVVLVCTALVMLLIWHPTTITWLPTCPTKALLGLDCPGCGSLRGMHHLLNGRWGQAWTLNPALVIIGLPALLLLMTELVSAVLWGRRLLIIPGGRFGIALALVLVAYFIGRNTV